ncbi:hypothetical protein D3C72_782680 [compost metagenome]
MLIDLQARNAVGIQFNGPAAIVFAYQNVRDHVLGFAGLDRLSGAWIEGLNQIHRLFQHIFFQAGNAHQRAEVVIRQQIEVIADDQPRFVDPRRLFRKLRQLNQQAITQIFRRHADWVKALDAF